MAQLGVEGRKQRGAGFAKLGARGFDIGQRFLHVAVAGQRDTHHFFEAGVIHHLLPVADHRGCLAVAARQGRRDRRGRTLIVRVERDAARRQERNKN